MTEDPVRTQDEHQQEQHEHDEGLVLAPERRDDPDDGTGEPEGVAAQDGASGRSETAEDDGDEGLDAEQLAALELDRQAGGQEDGAEGGQRAGESEGER